MKLVKKTRFFILGFALLSCMSAAQSQDWKQIATHKNEPFQVICDSIESWFSKNQQPRNKSEGSDWNSYQRWKWFWGRRLDDKGKIPSVLTLREGLMDLQNQAKDTDSAQCQWQYIDQVENDGGYWGMGRTTCICFHPSDNQTFYVGSANGGIWKTTNNGQTYTSLGSGLPYGAASNLLIDPQNPQIMYVSNGDHVGWWTYSSGVYKSTDAGATWTPTGLVFGAGAEAIYKLTMDPNNSQVIYAATTGGLYRTINGGQNWTLARSSSHSDVVFQPGSSQVIYTATDNYWGSSEVFKSINGGQTWTQITQHQLNYNFIKLTVTAQDTMRIAYRNSKPDNTLFESTDQGNTFIQRSVLPEGGVIGYAPNNPNVFYCGFLKVHRSVDSGQNWTQLTDWYNTGNRPEVHADQRNIGYPNSNQEIVFCNDGGVYRLNTANDAWTDHSNGLLIGQFYRIANSTQNPLKMIGGTQDNGGRMRREDGNWYNVNGGDGMEVAIEPGNDQVFYTTYIYGTGWNRTTDDGGSWTNIHQNIPGQPEGQWVTPYDLDPVNPQSIIAGYQLIYFSPDRGNTWSAISPDLSGNNEALTDLEIAPSNPQVIYAALNNKIYVTTDWGGVWTTRTVPGSAPVTRIAIHPIDPSVAWVTRGNYSSGMKVYKTEDYGLTWSNFSTGLPNVPHNCIIYQPGSFDRLFVANDLGVYHRDGNMSSWQLFGAGLPATQVEDLKIHDLTNTLRAGTYGRGVWEAPLCSELSSVEAKNIRADFITLYPNPTGGKVWIKSPREIGEYMIQITDITGKQIPFFEQPFDSELREISWNSEPGVYFITVIQPDRKESYRILKKP